MYTIHTHACTHTLLYSYTCTIPLVCEQFVVINYTIWASQETTLDRQSLSPQYRKQRKVVGIVGRESPNDQTIEIYRSRHCTALCKYSPIECSVVIHVHVGIGILCTVRMKNNILVHMYVHRTCTVYCGNSTLCSNSVCS